MLMDGVTDYAIILIDSAGKIVDWNVGAQRIFGYSKTEVLGGPAEVIFTSEDRELHIPKAEMKTALALGRADDERWHLRKDGTRFMASGVLTATKLQDGRPRGFVKILRDVTERQTGEKLLQRARIAEAISVLTAGVAHDFNNLLTSILGNTSLVLADLPETDPNRDFLREVVRVGLRAAELTRQLLAYTGKGKHIAKLLDLSQTVDEARESLLKSVPTAVEVIFHLERDVPLVRGDNNQIGAVIQALVTNAGEAIGDRVGKIEVRTRCVRLEGIALEDWGNYEVEPGVYVCCEVTDTGCGIEKEVLTKIFDPFFSTKFLGRGLGLASAHGIVRQHKGALQVTSEPGSGSCFRVYLPTNLDATKGCLQAAARIWEVRGQ